MVVDALLIRLRDVAGVFIGDALLPESEKAGALVVEIPTVHPLERYRRAPEQGRGDRDWTALYPSPRRRVGPDDDQRTVGPLAALRNVASVGSPAGGGDADRGRSRW